MRVLLQRVDHASVTVEESVVGSIQQGFLILLGICDGDGEAQIQKLVRKIVGLRVFNDEDGKFNRSLLDINGAALVVSQFTLYADCRKGRRPSFTGAARPEIAEPLVSQFIEALRREGVTQVESGSFGANMDVRLLNQGPVTIWLDSEELSR